MERTRTSANSPSRVHRQIATLKIVSRLLGHELHAQNSPRVTLSREEVHEIQTSIDLFIEEIMRDARLSGVTLATATAPGLEVQAVPARVN